MDWDQAYSNVDAVADSASIPPKMMAAAAAFRAETSAEMQLDVAYGPGERQKLDLFIPAGEVKGVAAYVHGGYWHKNEKSMFSHLAAGPLGHGWAVAIIGYTLCPETRVAAITQEIRAGLIKAADMVPGPVRIAGHSAGGHLVARMLCEDIDLPGDVAARLEHVVAISGVHDLRPVVKTQMNELIGLDAAEAAAESPALATPRDGARILAWVGGDELPEFLRQNKLIANIWTGFGVETRAHEAAGKNHFTVIDEISDPASPLVENWLKG